MALVEPPEVYDEEARELARNRQIRADLGRALCIIESSQESRTLNETDHACIILSASGRCEGGRGHPPPAPQPLAAQRPRPLGWLHGRGHPRPAAGRRGRPRLVLTHGEDPARAALRDAIQARYGLEALLPGSADVIRLD